MPKLQIKFFLVALFPFKIDRMKQASVKMSAIHCKCLCFRKQEKVRKNNLFKNNIFALAIFYCAF